MLSSCLLRHSLSQSGHLKRCNIYFVVKGTILSGKDVLRIVMDGRDISKSLKLIVASRSLISLVVSWRKMSLACYGAHLWQMPLEAINGIQYPSVIFRVLATLWRDSRPILHLYFLKTSLASPIMWEICKNVCPLTCKGNLFVIGTCHEHNKQI